MAGNIICRVDPLSKDHLHCLQGVVFPRVVSLLTVYHNTYLLVGSLNRGIQSIRSL